MFFFRIQFFCRFLSNQFPFLFSNAGMLSVTVLKKFFDTCFQLNFLKKNYNRKVLCYLEIYLLWFWIYFFSFFFRANGFCVGYFGTADVGCGCFRSLLTELMTSGYDDFGFGFHHDNDACEFLLLESNHDLVACCLNCWLAANHPSSHIVMFRGLLRIVVMFN